MAETRESFTKWYRGMTNEELLSRWETSHDMLTYESRNCLRTEMKRRGLNCLEPCQMNEIPVERQESDLLHRAVWLVPILLLILAIFDMPSGYYVFLRFAVAGALLFLLIRHVSRADGGAGWFWGFGVGVIVFNPFIPLWLTKTIWAAIDAVTAAALFVHMLKFRQRI